MHVLQHNFFVCICSHTGTQAAAGSAGSQRTSPCSSDQRVAARGAAGRLPGTVGLEEGPARPHTDGLVHEVPGPVCGRAGQRHGVSKLHCCSTLGCRPLSGDAAQCCGACSASNLLEFLICLPLLAQQGPCRWPHACSSWCSRMTLQGGCVCFKDKVGFGSLIHVSCMVISCLLHLAIVVPLAPPPLHVCCILPLRCQLLSSGASFIVPLRCH